MTKQEETPQKQSERTSNRKELLSDYLNECPSKRYKITLYGKNNPDDPGGRITVSHTCTAESAVAAIKKYIDAEIRASEDDTYKYSAKMFESLELTCELYEQS